MDQYWLHCSEVEIFIYLIYNQGVPFTRYENSSIQYMPEA